MVRFDSEIFKAHLRLAMARCRLAHGKLTASSRAARSAIADLLLSDRPDSARIKTRLVIRDDYLAEALEQVEGYCDDLIKSTGVLQLTGASLHDGVTKALHAVIYAQPRLEVPELALVVEDIQCRFGKDFVQEGRENGRGLVDSRLILKLSMRTHEDCFVEKYLGTIADSFGIGHKLELDPPPYSVKTEVPCSDEGCTLDDIARRFEELKRKPQIKQ
jgi:vacuolar protein sorting-associated protein IST1